MSRVTLTDIQTGDTCDLTATNAMLTAIDTATGQVNDENVRDGGLDERNFADNVAVIQPAAAVIFSTSAPGTINQNSSGVLAQVGASTDVVTGPYSYDPTSFDRFIVKISLRYKSVVPAVSATDGQFVFQLGYSTDYDDTTPGSGTWSMISTTLRRIGYRPKVSADSARAIGSLTIAHRFNASISSTDSLYFGLFVWDSYGAAESSTTDDIDIGFINFYALNHKK